MIAIETLLKKLGGCTRNGRGWKARCPAHDDRQPSLSVSVGDDGRILVHCHAGCTPEAVVAALGLTMADLMPERDYSSRRPTVSTRGSSGGQETGRSYTMAKDAVASLERRLGPRSAMWTYQSADGKPVGVVVRWDRPKGGKEIRPVSRRADGMWVIGAMPEPRPLYRLGELSDADCVLVCEGEKATDAACQCGFAATTSSGGSKAAKKTEWSPLAGKSVVILPDNDEPGEQYATDVIATLASLRPQPSVKLLRLVERWQDLPRGGDLADVLAGVDEPEAIRTELDRLIDKAELVEFSPPKRPPALYSPFPVDVLPEPLRSFVSHASEAIGCDASYLALPVLAVCAAAIGTTRRLALKRTWAEPPIVWTAIVGDSGTKKSPGFKLAVKPLRDAQAEAFKEVEHQRSEYVIEKAKYDRAFAMWKATPTGDPPVEPPQPTSERCVVSDTTIEALARVLKTNPRGVLLARDELSGWLGSIDRYAQRRGGEVSHWLSMFIGEEVTVDRKTGDEQIIFVPQAAVWIVGGIQPKVLKRMFGGEHTDNGLLARFLLVMPPRLVARWTETDVPFEIAEAYGSLIHRLRGLRPGGPPDSPEPVAVSMTAEGRAAWVSFYDEHAEEQTEAEGPIAAALSKLEAYAARLALVMHFVRWAAGDSTLADPDRVDERSVAIGVTLVRWFANETRRIYATVLDASSPEDATRGKVLDLIQRKKGSISGSELVRASRSFGQVVEAEASLDELVREGLGHWEHPQQSRGRPPARRFVLNAEPICDVGVYEKATDATGSGVFVDIDSVDAVDAPDAPSETLSDLDPDEGVI